MTMPARILLVDDEDIVLDAWETSLRPLKHQIIKAHDDNEALAAALEHPVDLVIVDYLIPPKTGVEIVAAIRKSLPLIRSILISGRFDEKLSRLELREMVREKVEVDEYLHKPVKPKLLRDTVTKLLAGTSPEWREIALKTQTARAVSATDTAELKEKLNKHLKPKK
jgi:response regulator RpfG family c-di-GMP phosphodiesterase